MPIKLKQGSVITPLPEDAIVDITGQSHGDPYRIQVTQNGQTDEVWKLKLKTLTASFNPDDGLITWNDIRVNGRPLQIRYDVKRIIGTTMTIIGGGINVWAYDISTSGVDHGSFFIEAYPEDSNLSYIQHQSVEVVIEAPEPPDPPGPTPPRPGEDGVYLTINGEVFSNGRVFLQGTLTDHSGSYTIDNTSITYPADTSPAPEFPGATGGEPPWGQTDVTIQGTIGAGIHWVCIRVWWRGGPVRDHWIKLDKAHPGRIGTSETVPRVQGDSRLDVRSNQIVISNSATLSNKQANGIYTTVSSCTIKVANIGSAVDESQINLVYDGSFYPPVRPGDINTPTCIKWINRDFYTTTEVSAEYCVAYVEYNGQMKAENALELVSNGLNPQTWPGDSWGEGAIGHSYYKIDMF